MKNILLFCLLILFGFGCENSKQKTDIVELLTPGTQNLPSLSQENIDGLMANTDHIDVIFQGYGKSISFSEKLAIQNMVRQISLTPQADIDCATSFCRIIYYKLPDKLLEGEIHYGNGCAYFIFPDIEGKPQYASQMNPSGVAFFNDLINKFNASTKQ